MKAFKIFLVLFGFFSLGAYVPYAITSLGKNLRVESASVGATGTVTNESGDWINGNCTNASPRVCTLNSSIFSSTPVCVATTTSGTQYYAGMSAASTSSISINTYLDNGVATAVALNVVCMGVR